MRIVVPTQSAVKIGEDAVIVLVPTLVLEGSSVTLGASNFWYGW